MTVDEFLSISHLYPAQRTNGGTVTPDVRAPEGSRVSEVSDEGACVSGCHRILLLKHSLWFTKHNGVMETPELCLLCAYYLRPGACVGNGSSTGLARLNKAKPKQAENSSDPTPRDRAEPLVPECLRRFLGSSSFPPPSPFLLLAPAGLAVLAGFLKWGGGSLAFCLLGFFLCLFAFLAWLLFCLFAFWLPSSSRCLLR